MAISEEDVSTFGVRELKNRLTHGEGFGTADLEDHPPRSPRMVRDKMRAKESQ